MGPVGTPNGSSIRTHAYEQKEKQNQSTHQTNHHESNKDQPTTNQPTTTTNQQRYTRYVPRAPPSWRWAPLYLLLLLHPPT
mmetsp:Transcript_6915/g.15819  ORF Transcript_6915/g.15819 Transcript_6915/m.15819 type:complete len:81 (+) Transcript_6915:351-593(+)